MENLEKIVRCGDVESLRVLLESKTDPDMTIDCDTKIEYFPLLHCAIQHNQLTCVQLLLESKANPKRNCPSGFSLSWHAGVDDNNYAGLRMLLQASSKENDFRHKLHYMALKKIKKNDIYGVQSLLELKADINYIDTMNWSQSLLRKSILCQSIDCVDMLIRKKVDINPRHYPHMTPLDCAVKYMYKDGICALMEAKANMTDLIPDHQQILKTIIKV